LEVKLFIHDTNKCTSEIHKYNLISLLHDLVSHHILGALHQDLKLTKIQEITKTNLYYFTVFVQPM
jgi:hypothetical protein